MNAVLPRAVHGHPFHGVIGRAVVLVPAVLALWWFLLQPVSLWLLRVTAYVPLALLVAPAGMEPVRVDGNTGEWRFNVAVNTVVKNFRTGQQQSIDSLEFAVGPDSVAFFTVGWFSYLALAWSAAGFSRGQIARLLKGIAWQTGINVLSLAAYVYINGYGTAINVPGNDDFRLWLMKYSYHLIYLVVPFASPFVVALVVYPEWRAYITPNPPGGNPRPKNKKGRG